MTEVKAESDDPTNPLRGVVGWLGQVIAWVVIVAVVLVLSAAVLVPRLGGATPYTILTGSMRPDMPPGTLVVAKPVNTRDIGIGTVVTYQLDSGKATAITHRVVGLAQDHKGRPLFTTQGDANPIPDEKSVMPIQIKGARWYYVPYLGYVNSFITGKERHITMIIVVSALFLYAAAMFTGSLSDRIRKPRKHSFGSPS